MTEDGVVPTALPTLVATYTFYIAANEHYSKHTHTYHELLVVQRGRLRVHLAGKEHIAGPGDILFYPADSAHEEWAEDGEPVLTWVCLFQCADLDVPFCCHDSNGRVQELLSKLTWKFLISRFPRPGDQQACLLMLQMLLAELRRLGPQEPQEMVDRVRAYILAHIKESFTLDDLSSISGISKYSFVRQYRAITGRTPMEDARFLRVTQAYHLVTGTTLSLHDIAPLVGLRDGCHLSRLLNSILGIGSRKLRKSGDNSPPESKLRLREK